MPRCYCRYCYEYGHNKMGCPKAKAEANDPNEGDGTLSPLQQYDEWNNKREKPYPDSAADAWPAYRLHGWSNKIREAVEIQLKKRARSRKVKTCNYCGATGHNKRTCPSIKLHKKLILDGERAYRLAALQKLKDIGLGIGSTVTGEVEHYVDGKGWQKFQGIGLVTDIDYRWFSLSDQHLGLNLGTARKREPLTIRWNNGAKTTSEIPKAFKESVDDVFATSYWRDDWTMLAPSGSVAPPDDFLDASDVVEPLKKYFKAKDSNAAHFHFKDSLTNRGKTLEKWSGSKPIIEEE